MKERKDTPKTWIQTVTMSWVDSDCLCFVLFTVRLRVCFSAYYRGGSLNGDSMTDGWLKLVFVIEILVRPMSSSAT